MQHDVYAEWAPHYPASPHNPLMEVEQAAVCSLLPPVAGRRVLDAGCGTGRYARLLRERSAAIVGVDCSAAMLARAAGAVRLRVRADAGVLPIASAAVDVVVAGLCLMDMADLDAAFAEWARVLRLDGCVISSTLHPRGRDIGWTRTFTVPDGERTLPVCWHTRADHMRACRRAGLTIDHIVEPSWPAGGPPVALVLRARRTG